MIVYIISFTQNGDKLNDKIKSSLKQYDIKAYPWREKRASLYEWTDRAFKEADAIIFIGAAGIAVRATAPFIENKVKDPAVVVCDELGKYAIPILSGHIGGANELAAKLGEIIGAVPVITTATDINDVWAVDTWAVKKGFKIHNIDAVKYISSALLQNKKVGLISDVTVDKGELPLTIEDGNTSTECGIVISPFVRNVYKHTLNIIPKCIAIGVGSRKNASENAVIELFNKIINENNIDKYAIAAAATIDIKINEPSVIKFFDFIGVKPVFYTAGQLNSVKGEFTGSDFVKRTTGVDSVCERCAAALSEGGELIIRKTAFKGVTIAMALKKDCFNVKSG